MKLMSLIISLTFSNFLNESGNATKYEALVIQEKDNELLFADVGKTVTGLFSQYTSLGWRLLYYLCPKQSEAALQIQTKVLDGYGPTKKICANEVIPSILKVLGEFENNEGREDIHLYDIGFTVIDIDKEFKSVTTTKQYLSMRQGDYFIPMISFYHDKTFQHTIAVSYEILSTDIRKELSTNLAETYQSISLFVSKVEPLFRDQKSKLTEILGRNYIESKHVLVLDSLVNENNFIIETWKKTARYKVHQILLWKEKLQVWRNIQEFVRYIASTANARITIYAGIGKTLSITGIDEKKYKLEWNEREERIFIPELYWTAVNFTNTRGYDQETTGMFIIMHNEPPNILESNVEKICATDFCQTNEIWNIMEGAEKMEGQVYCCPIDSKTIKKLDTNFLLKNRPFFRGRKGMGFPPK